MTDAADSSWRPPATRWPWRNFLTTEEKTTILKADTAKAVWLKLNQNRAAIINRALQRARYGRMPRTLSPRERRRRCVTSEQTKGEQTP